MAIAVFVALVVGSFIWFIAKWDNSGAEAHRHTAPLSKHEATA
jgi:hypothetical protein